MRMSLVVAVVLASVAAGAVWAAETFGEPPAVKVLGPFTEEQVRRFLGTPSPLPLPTVQDDSAYYRKPILNAAGTHPVGPDEQRITIPVDGVLYEVVTAKPGMGRLLPVDR